MENKDVNKMQIYSYGIVYCSVCVQKDVPPAQIEKDVNAEHPTGIHSSWKIAKENFRSGEANPHQCEHEEDRLHYLLVC